MKKIIIMTLFTGLIIECKAQQVDINDLQAPSSPAFTILGIQPSEINKPKSYKAIEASLLSGFSNNGSVSIPNSYAIEISPFWLKSRPEVSFSKLMQPGADILKHSLAFSLATTERKDLSISTNSYRQLSLGARMTFFPGKLKKDVDQLAQEVRESLAPIANVLGVLNNADAQVFANKAALKSDLDTRFNGLLADPSLASFISQIRKIKNEVVLKNLVAFDAQSNDECHIIIQKMIQDAMSYSENNNIEKVIDKTRNYYYERIGFRMDAAIATIIDFPTNDFNYSNLSKYAIWVTPSWASKEGKWEFLGVVRFIGGRVPSITTSNWDLGGRSILNLGRFQVSVEYIQRSQITTEVKTIVQGANPNEVVKTLASAQKWDNRTSVNFQFRLSDKFVLTYALGKNFILNAQSNGSLISLIGINFGTGGPVVDFGK